MKNATLGQAIESLEDALKAHADSLTEYKKNPRQDRPEEPPRLVVARDHLAKVLAAAKTVDSWNHWSRSERKIDLLVREICRLEKESSCPNAPAWRAVKAMAKKYAAQAPEELYDDDSLVAIRCASCHGLTLLTWGTEYYHCSKCGQKIRLYEKEGYCGLGRRH